MSLRAALAAWWALVAPAVPSFAQGPDTTTYADRATQSLVTLARQRHERQDSLVRNYRAVVHTRADAAVGRSRFARLLPLVAHETAARVSWRRPNDLRLELLGIRERSVFPSEADVAYDRPWFVPRALSDSIHLMGIPETAALHPLARGAQRFYRYAITDSVILTLPTRVIRAIGVRVTPKHLGPSMVAGEMWVDAEGADVVRLMVTFLGEYLWETPAVDATNRDSARVRRENQWAQRIVTVQADLEYSLHEDRYWMPYRQLLALTLEVDFLIRGALPVRFITTFRDYDINTDGQFAFELSLDSTTSGDTTVCRACPDHHRSRDRRLAGYIRTGRWTNGQWEIAVPPGDSLLAYDGWRDSLQLALTEVDAERIRRTVADLASLAERLPDDWVGRRRWGLAWDELADIARFNRVQGLSLGVGYEWRPGPDFTAVRAGARFGLSDKRFTGSLTWRRDAPGGLLEVDGYRRVLETEPWSDGQSLGNSLNAVFTAHDDADYYLGLGARTAFTPYAGPLRDTEFALAYERHRSMQTRTGSGINDALGGDGVFQPNPPVQEGEFVRAAIAPRWRWGRTSIRAGVETLLGDAVTGGRAWATGRIPFAVAGRSGALSLKVGHVAGGMIPQLQFRVGGPETVRGHAYGAVRGDGFWSAQLDMAVWRRWVWSPVVFVDAGGTFDANDPLVGFGVGFSVFSGWLRLNLAKGVNPSNDLRFDLLFGAPR